MQNSIKTSIKWFDDHNLYKSVTISLCFTIINTKPETNLSNVILFIIVYTHPLHIFRIKATKKTCYSTLTTKEAT